MVSIVGVGQTGAEAQRRPLEGTRLPGHLFRTVLQVERSGNALLVLTLRRVVVP